jgi:aminoglycoside phosphotransferase (APT) family kinase protein
MADGFDEEQQLIAWLGERLDVASGITLTDFRRPQGSGFSAETQIFTATFERDGRPASRKLVLRLETPDPAVYPQQAPGYDVEIDIQYCAMSALRAHSTVPIAPLVGYEADASVLGRPFFVMEFVDGVVPIESPLYTTQGFFVDASPADRRRMIEAGLRALADLHRVDHRAAGLDWLVPDGVTPGTAHQLDLWEQYCRRELGDREHPLFDEAMAWLRPRIPVDPFVTLCWGDARPGNIIWRDFSPACLTDFEAVAIASPDQDLGWWLMFDHWVHETPGVERLPGEPTREEQREIYATHAGRDVGDLRFHEIFAATRYAAIVVRVMNRAVARGLMPPEQTVWRNNPATVCLDLLLRDVR